MGEGVTSLVYFEKMVPFSSANGLNSEITTSSHYLLSKRKRREKRMKSMRELQSEYFLSHIPMGGEGQISGYKGLHDGSAITDLSSTPQTDIVEVSGKQNYEYKSIQKLCEPGTILKSGLYVFSPNKTFPLAITSFIGIEEEDDKDVFITGADESDDRLLLYEKMNNVRRNKDPEQDLNVSYEKYIKPFTTVNTENIYLDNAYIQQSSQTSILFFDGWTSSVIPYIKETQLKRELNSIFQNNYPDIPKDFTLSKLRKLKHLSLMLCQPSIVFPSIHISLKNAKTVDYDIGTLALAFCYFERLALYGHVNKGNRKIVCADCLFIAYKFNQLCEVSSVEKTMALETILEELNTLFGVAPDRTIANEIEVLVALEFSLLVPYNQYIEHIFWILKKLDTNLQTYLGEAMYESYYKALHYDELCGKEEEEEEEETGDGRELGSDIVETFDEADEAPHESIVC
ncbi:hypothetical protein WA588_000894 [Blastocystis sp. NMH]